MISKYKARLLFFLRIKRRQHNNEYNLVYSINVEGLVFTVYTSLGTKADKWGFQAKLVGAADGLILVCS